MLETDEVLFPVPILPTKPNLRLATITVKWMGVILPLWLEEKLLPNLEEPSAIVLDNASYQSMRGGQISDIKFKEGKLQEWFTKQGIHFSPAMLRPQLLQLARVNRPPPEYTVDQTIRLHGLEVLRLPPCHPDFNAIELIWSQLKDYVRRMNTSFRYDDVLQTVNDTFHHIDGDRWRRACEHVEKHVAECMRDDHAVDQHINAIVINLADTSESESTYDDDL